MNAKAVRGLFFLAILGSLGSIGCQSAPVRQAPRWAPWAKAQGGLIDGAPLEKLTHAAGLLHLGTVPSVHVLNSERAGAWSWANGTIFVTRHLVNIATEHELSAAIAHELGHFKGTPRTWRIAAIAGRQPDVEVEERADANAVELLSQAGIDPHCLSSLLCKLRAMPELSKRVELSLDQRIGQLDQNIPR